MRNEHQQLPRYGNEHHIHTSDNDAYQTDTPPTCGRGNDWLLLLAGEAEAHLPELYGY